jgi:hypothetical protein
VSPVGLSPMRSRTPTKNNVSPFKNIHNDNRSGHSPIKFIHNNNNRTFHQNNNPQINGFFRTDNNHYPQNYNNKYGTCVNDHSIKFYENSSSSNCISNNNGNHHRIAKNHEA